MKIIWLNYFKLKVLTKHLGNDSNLLIVFYVQIMPDDFVMQLHRF
ncbi:pilus assembly protein [Escherichia coli]|nr:pilus assembly protein [Escherichia coli]